VEVAGLWVHLDHRTGRPVRLGEDFFERYGAAAGGRRVKARLRHGEPPDAPTERWPWHLRATDLDVLDHVNNAACWEVVEEALVTRPHLRGPLRAELEHRTALERGSRVEVLVQDGEGEGAGFALWARADGAVAVSATVEPLARGDQSTRR
jgi:acyl-ACP thioesterase